MCETVLGIYKCYRPAAAVMTVFILYLVWIYGSVAELKSPIRSGPLFYEDSTIILQH